MHNQIQFTHKELYVMGIILNEASEKWLGNRTYQDIKRLINEELSLFSTKQQEGLEFKREYECMWIGNEGFENQGFIQQM